MSRTDGFMRTRLLALEFLSMANDGTAGQGGPELDAESEVDAPGAGDLHSLLFEDKGGAPEQVAAPAKGLQRLLERREGKWPVGVPTSQEAGDVLTGKLDVEGVLVGPTQRILAALTDRESAELFREDGTDAPPLRRAILLRWRLEVAIAVKPAAGDQLDAEALEALVQEIDQVLGALQVPADADEPTRMAFDAARSEIARDAVALTELAESASRTSAEQSAEKVVKRYEHVARILSSGHETEADRRERRRLKLMFAVAGVLALANAAYYGRGLVGPRPEQDLQSLAPGLKLVTPSVRGTPVVVETVPGETKPGDIELMKQSAELRGDVLFEMGSGQYGIRPGGEPPTEGAR